MAVSNNLKFLVDNRLDNTATVLSSNQTVQAALTNLKTPDRKDFTRLNGTTNVQITVDLGSAQSIQAIAWVYSNMRNGATVEIRHSTDNFSANDVLLATVTIVRPTVIQGGIEFFLHHNYLFDTLSKRYWRLVLADSGNPDGYLTLGRLFVGAYVETTNDISFPWSWKPVFRSQRTETAGGTPLGERLPPAREYTAAYENNLVEADLYNTLHDMFMQVGDGLDIWLVPFPNNATKNFRAALYGRFLVGPEFSAPFYRAYSGGPLQFREGL